MNLLLDCNYLCCRAYHGLGGASGGPDVALTTIKSFFLIFTILFDQFRPNRCCFCFDSSSSARFLAYPLYRESRRRERLMMNDMDKKARQELNYQIKLLRLDYLLTAGFRNICYQSGYEADDLIASAVRSISEMDKVVIVTADQDLYQLLAENISIWNPVKKERYTLQSFWQEWGIGPDSWPIVKAMAGCKSDDVVGIYGIGEKTAVKYITGKLSPKASAQRKIREGQEIIERNMPIVTLPYEGTRRIKLVDDEVTRERWFELCEWLGMESLMGRPPVLDRSILKGRKR